MNITRRGCHVWGVTIPTGPAFRFSTRLQFQLPPNLPVEPKAVGPTCFRATCAVTQRDGVAPGPEVLGCPVGMATGYGRSPQVAQDTYDACRAHVDNNFPRRGISCGEAELVLLSATQNRLCLGEIFFEFAGKPTVRLS